MPNIPYSNTKPAYLTYGQNLALEYPKISGQHDMLYNAMKKREISKANDFFNAIDSVKKKYPKV